MDYNSINSKRKGKSKRLEVSYEASHIDELKQQTCFKCKYIIEPVVFLQSIASSLIGIAFNQFIYNRILERITDSDTTPFDNVTNLTLFSRLRDSDLPDGQANEIVCNANTSFTNGTSPYDNIRIQAQQQTAALLFLCAIFGGIPCIISTNILGVNCSKLGRKTLLLITLFAMNVRNIIYIFQALYPDLPDYLFYITSLLDGISGSNGVFYLALHCYVSDTTSSESRSYRITLVNYMSSITGLFVTFGCGYMITYLGYVYVFAIAFVFHLLSFVYTVFCVPEPIVTLRDKSFVSRVASCSLKSITNCFKVYMRKSHPVIVNKMSKNDASETDALLGGGHVPEGDDDEVRCVKPAESTAQNVHQVRQRAVLILVVVANMIYCFAANGIGSIFSLYVMNAPFCWDPIEISAFSLYNTVLNLFLSLLISKFCRVHDILICISSAFTNLVSLVVYGYAKTSVMVYAAAGISAIAGLEFSYARSIVSKLVTKYEISDAFTLISVVDTTTAVMANILVPYIYGKMVSDLVSFIFFWLAGIILVTISLHCVAFKMFKSSEELVMVAEEVLVEEGEPEQEVLVVDQRYELNREDRLMFERSHESCDYPAHVTKALLSTFHESI